MAKSGAASKLRSAGAGSTGDTRQALVRAAIETLKSEGFAGASARAIAGRRWPRVRPGRRPGEGPLPRPALDNDGRGGGMVERMIKPIAQIKGDPMAKSGTVSKLRSAGAGGTGDTRQALVRAAIETLKSEGFAGASARAIAGRAGCNQGLVFYLSLIHI